MHLYMYTNVNILKLIVDIHLCTCIFQTHAYTSTFTQTDKHLYTHPHTRKGVFEDMIKLFEYFVRKIIHWRLGIIKS